MAKSQAEAAGRRQRIVAAAAEILVEVGLREATTRAVTERAGVGTGLLNHYFRWPELRAEAWAGLFASVADRLFPAEAAPDARIEAYFRDAFADDARPYWQLWSEAVDLAPGDAEMARVLGEAQSRLHAGLAGALAEGVAAGLWRLADADATALRLGALYDGLAGLLLSGVADLDAGAAERHLRTAFRLECALDASRAT